MSRILNYYGFSHFLQAFFQTFCIQMDSKWWGCLRLSAALVESGNLSTQVYEMLQQDLSNSFRITTEGEFHQIPELHASCLLLDATNYFE